MQPCLSVLQEYWISKDQPIKWRWAIREGHSPYKDLQNHGVIYLDAEEMFWARVSRHLFYLACCSSIRWWQFLREPVANEGLRCLCRNLAKAFDSDLVIYVPDSGGRPGSVSDLLYSEAGIQDAVTWLQTNCGPPAHTSYDIFPEGADVVNENGYFIEPVP